MAECGPFTPRTDVFDNRSFRVMDAECVDPVLDCSLPCVPYIEARFSTSKYIHVIAVVGNSLSSFVESGAWKLRVGTL